MSSSRGFTLMELLVALVIAGLLIVIALPTYSYSRIRTERNEGRIALLHQATRQSSFFISNGRYAMDMTELGFENATSTTENGRFALEIVRSDATGFVIRASRTDTDADPDCHWYSVDQSQTRQSGPSGPADCWQR
ncbi:MAG: type IV pilin protein [Pseudomonadota bacterium]